MNLPFSHGRDGRNGREGHAASVRLGTRELAPFVRLPFSLSEQQLRSHLHVMGTTGMGKSKFLAHFATQLILQGRACSVIDPHADLATDILAILLDRGYFRRPDATTRVLYVDFGNSEAFIPFNVLRVNGQSHTIAGSVLEAFHRAWPALADGAAPTFDTLILNGVKVLLSNNLPLPRLYQLLTDRDYRNQLLQNERDENVVAVWRTWFDRLSARDQADQAGAALRRANLLSFHPTLRYSLGQVENALDLRALMDHQVSVIFNLGGLDELTQRLLGCLLSVGFETAALSREDTPEERRLPYHLLMDEFSMFSAQSEEALARVVSLARKYKLFLVLAHQTWSQLSERLHGALQNSTPLFFRLGFDDAMWAAPRLSEANPYTVKHAVRPLARELPMEYHPSYLSLSEQDRLMAARIENLWPQQAYIKVERQVPRLLRRVLPHARVLKITTATLPRTRSSHEQIEALKATYARLLLTPRSVLEATPTAAPRASSADAGSHERSIRSAGGEPADKSARPTYRMKPLLARKAPLPTLPPTLSPTVSPTRAPNETVLFRTRHSTQY